MRPDATSEAAGVHVAPTIGRVWQMLQDIPDPEIPPVSIVDLGMVRGVDWDGATDSALVVRLTPTYSGCPATDLIIGAVRERLLAGGVPHVDVRLELSPAWSTDWITAEGRRKLREYGIAPPDALRQATPAQAVVNIAGISPLRRAAGTVTCPRCGATNTRLVSQFGSTACKAHYVCNDCLEPFDFMKPLR